VGFRNKKTKILSRRELSKPTALTAAASTSDQASGRKVLHVSKMGKEHVGQRLSMVLLHTEARIVAVIVRFVELFRGYLIEET